MIDNRLNPSDLIFVVYSLGDRLKKISLTQTSPSAKCLGSLFGVVNNKLHIDGWSTELGCQEIKGTRFLILSRDNARTYFFIFNTYKKLVISSDEFAGIKSPGKTRLILDQDRLIVDIKEADVYYNDQKVDERIFSINALGQYELMYDPTEEVVQGKDTSDLPSQLDAVITEITHIFEGASYTRPDQPWLPNLAENIPTPQVKLGTKPTLSVPLGLLDIPSDQAQVNYDFDLLKQGNTVILASSGYGKSTLLQTLSLNLAGANTPEQVQLNLLDFGNNGLLPLKDLPHVADIVTLEETEKMQKMLAGIVATLASRKRAFKTAGVASLEQYESKTQLSLPIIVNLLDNYDGLSLEDSRKQQIDNSLLQVLREGPSMGVYLVLTASRLGAVRANMMSAIPTKLVLYLNDAGEVTTIMGRASVQQEAKAGRGQVMLDVPRAIQFYLPVAGETSTTLLENLEQAVAQLDQNWTGTRPAKIPMVPEELTGEVFETFIPVKEANTLYLGLDKISAEITSFSMFKGNAFGLFMETNKQANLILPRILQQVTRLS
ncbi:FtsK/SpoIIIE domain-containing protein, partial [Lactococcus paracarnosus]|uniref:FtsK/SpoIIIE domain-containing protein n=1 Tax=Pseudolactococcus paracarnosus TaxID=2749962 RepID=UPI00237ABA55